MLLQFMRPQKTRKYFMAFYKSSNFSFLFLGCGDLGVLENYLFAGFYLLAF